MALVAGCAPTDEGASHLSSRRGDDSILNGQDTSEYPAVVMLMQGGQVFCTGTVIAPRKVLTAAHCADSQSVADQIGIGASDAAIEQTVPVEKSTPHPSYDSQTLAFDVAVLTLGEDAPVAPVALNTSMDDSWVGRQIRLVGYGVNDGAAQTGSGTKRMVDIEIGEVTATHMLYTDTGGKSACNGDSGGPALLDDNGNLTVVAVASYVNMQGCTGGGGHYRVDALLDWIQTEAALDPNQVPQDPNDPNQPDPNDPNQPDPNDLQPARSE